MKLISLGIFPETLKALKEEAQKRGISLSGLIRMVLMDFIRKQKDTNRPHGTE